MNYISVCSGIEAATVAWHPLGWKPLAFAEIEPFPRAVLQHHYPDVPLYGDFTELRHQPWIVDADVLVGGTPCQSFSVAGLRKSLGDHRGNLSLEFIRLANAIDDLRRDAGREPVVIVWENVPGVFSTKDNAFGSFMGGLVGSGASIDVPHAGWPDAGVVAGPERHAAWRVLDAQFFGLAQRRRRVFVLSVGGTRAWLCADALLPIGASLRGDSAPSREAREGTTYSTAPSLTASGRGTERTGESRGQDCVIPEVVNAMTERPDRGGGNSEGQRLVPIIAPCLTVNYGKQPDNSDTNAGPMLVAFSVKDHGADAGELSPTLRSGGHDKSHANGGVMTAIAFAQNQRDEVRTMEVAGALAGEPGMKQQTYLHHAMQVRRLTPRECERLQGFPDDYTLIPYRNKPAADGPRYKALGNSMAVPVMAWIGKRIQMVSEITAEAVA